MSHCARKRIKSLRHNQVRMTNRELSRVFRPKTCTRSSLSHKILRLPNLMPYTTRWLRGAVIDLACPLFHLIWKKRSVSCWPTIRSRSTQSVSYASSDTFRDRSHPPLSLAASVGCVCQQLTLNFTHVEASVACAGQAVSFVTVKIGACVFVSGMLTKGHTLSLRKFYPNLTVYSLSTHWHHELFRFGSITCVVVWSGRVARWLVRGSCRLLRCCWSHTWSRRLSSPNHLWLLAFPCNFSEANEVVRKQGPPNGFDSCWMARRNCTG